MASKEGVVNVGKVLIQIAGIALKARMGLYGKNPIVAVTDIKLLVDDLIAAYVSVKEDFDKDFNPDDEPPTK